MPPTDAVKPGVNPICCLTLDVEPDYGRADSCAILDRAEPFFDWLRAERMPLMAFVTGELLDRGHRVLDLLNDAGASLGVHGHRHAAGDFGTMRDSHAGEIERSADAYSRRIGRPPRGYRAPAGIISREDILLLDRRGFRYDASVFPLRRPGRYDFAGLPRTPFRWEGTRLVEMPFGLMTSFLPAGMTFINLLGAPLSAGLIRRAARLLPFGAGAAGYVIDLHLHNLFSHPPALRSVPAAMRLMYRTGEWGGGLPRLQKLVGRLRLYGFAFRDLEADVVRRKSEDLPACGFDCFERAP